MVQNVKIARKTENFWLIKEEYQNFEKHACQNTVAMETSNCLDQDLSHQNVARKILGKIAEFGGVCFNIRKVINVQS